MRRHDETFASSAIPLLFTLHIYNNCYFVLHSSVVHPFVYRAVFVQFDAVIDVNIVVIVHIVNIVLQALYRSSVVLRRLRSGTNVTSC